MNKWTHKVVLLPFMLCAGFLLVLGKSLGLSYKQISVIFNLYLQGGVLALSGIMPLVAIVLTILEHPNCISWLVMLLSIFYASIYVVGFVGLLRHYHLPMNYAFDLCVNDLEFVASKWHISYHAVNLVIFILWWVTIVAINLFVSYSIYNL
jgi:hypothetical protein